MPQPDNLAEAWLNSFRRTLGRFSNLFIAEVDGKMAGFALVRIKRTPPYYGGMLVGELSDIWIAEYARRLGVGEKLTQLAFDWLREQDVHSIELQVLEGNELGHNFFKRLGFSPELRQYRLVVADSRPLHA
jgi:ribosomal protein S18 acetylase RimI-like enzyme